jgi:hypothetical protein
MFEDRERGKREGEEKGKWAEKRMAGNLTT